MTGPEVDSVVGGTTYTDQNHKVKTTYYDEDRQVVMEADLNQEGDGKLKHERRATNWGGSSRPRAMKTGRELYHMVGERIHRDGADHDEFQPAAQRAGAGADGWTRTTRDQLGRVTEAATFLERASLPTRGQTATGRVRMTSAYYANQTTVTDQAGKQRRSVTDGLGRLSQAIEDPERIEPSNRLHLRFAGQFATSGAGDAEPVFMYDSLSRLIRARNPEQDVNTNFNLSDPVTSNGSWTMKYTYL
ncbi:MAG: hypothetical protein KIT57_04865 [Blastocatellales bacterium]|nr:hypothetical protein [Blastocatellales bacterium]